MERAWRGVAGSDWLRKAKAATPVPSTTATSVHLMRRPTWPPELRGTARAAASVVDCPPSMVSWMGLSEDFGPSSFCADERKFEDDELNEFDPPDG